VFSQASRALRGDLCNSVEKGVADARETDAASKLAKVVFILKMEGNIIFKMKGESD
jgi:hypothetical protein